MQSYKETIQKLDIFFIIDIEEKNGIILRPRYYRNTGFYLTTGIPLNNIIVKINKL